MASVGEPCRRSDVLWCGVSAVSAAVGRDGGRGGQGARAAGRDWGGDAVIWYWVLLPCGCQVEVAEGVEAPEWCPDCER